MLTNEQIDYLYAFCRKHSVTYYDVQVELVDHLANAIEEKMLQQPALDFEAALLQVYKGFGVMGFGPVVREKEKAVQKHNTRLFWRYFRQQWRWPEIVVVLTIFLATFMATQYANKEVVRWGAMLVFLAATVMTTRPVACLRRLQKRSGQKFLLVNLAGILNITYAPFNVLIFVNQFGKDADSWLQGNLFKYVTFSMVFAIYIVFAMATYRSVRHVEGLLRKSYPNLFKTAAN